MTIAEGSVHASSVRARDITPTLHSLNQTSKVRPSCIAEAMVSILQPPYVRPPFDHFGDVPLELQQIM